jgi:hypothetical protein
MKTEDLYHFINEEKYAARLMDHGISPEETEVLAYRRTLEVQAQIEHEPFECETEKQVQVERSTQ